MSRQRQILTGQGDRETPQWLYDLLDEEFHFQLDVCATPANTKHERWLGEQVNGSFIDGLKANWSPSNWCNPPYNRGQIALWLKKGLAEALAGNLTVFLLPCDPSTEWFRWTMDMELRLLTKRLKFDGIKAGAPFPSLLAVRRPVNPHWRVLR